MTNDALVSLEELELLLTEDRAFCERCADDFSLVLAIYKIELTPEKWEVVILCDDCAPSVYRFLCRIRGKIPK